MENFKARTRKAGFGKTLELHERLLGCGTPISADEFYSTMEAQLAQMSVTRREVASLKKTAFYWQAAFSFVAVLAIWLVAMRLV